MNKKTSILHIEWSDGWGGQEIRILAESKEFIKRGYTVIIAAQPGSQLLKRANKSNVPTIPLKMNKALNLSAVIKLVYYIKRKSINIVHTHSSVDSRTGGIAGKIAGIKVVRSRHISVPVSKSFFTWFQYAKIADKLITSGEFIREKLINENNIPPNQIVSAPAGVDETLFRFNVESEDIREKFKLKDTYYIIGMVSVIRSWKGHEYVIKAMPNLIKKIPNIHLLIVGDGPVKDQVLELIKKLSLEKYITLTGHQPNPVPFYKVMDIVILPSYAGEATSQTLPQAMLMKIPIVSTNIGGLPEVVINKKTGLVVRPKNSNDIYNNIFEIFSNKKLRDSIVKKAEQHALENFTFKKMVDTTENVYSELLK